MIIAGVRYQRTEVEAARALLRELGQSERAIGTVLRVVRAQRIEVSPAPPAGGGPPGGDAIPAHRRVEAKRAAVDQLARRWSEFRRALNPDFKYPQAQARVNAAMGVRSRSEAGERELDRGLRFLQGEIDKLTRLYPDRADSLNMPGSIDGIIGRLERAVAGQAPDRSGG